MLVCQASDSRAKRALKMTSANNLHIQNMEIVLEIDLEEYTN